MLARSRGSSSVYFQLRVFLLKLFCHWSLLDCGIVKIKEPAAWRGRPALSCSAYTSGVWGTRKGLCCDSQSPTSALMLSQRAFRQLLSMRVSARVGVEGHRAWRGSSHPTMPPPGDGPLTAQSVLEAAASGQCGLRSLHILPC